MKVEASLVSIIKLSYDKIVMDSTSERYCEIVSNSFKNC